MQVDRGQAIQRRMTRTVTASGDGAALVTYQVCCGTRSEGVRERPRAVRYRRRARAQGLARAIAGSGKPPRICMCGCNAHHSGDAVEVVATENDGAALSNVLWCGSVWTCPVCGGIIRAARGREIAQGVETWQRDGHGVYFVTLTVRHRRGDSLSALLDLLTDAWRKVTSSAVWVRTRRRLGIRGYVRALEITWSWDNGWHPHFHFLFFTDDAATDEGAALLRSAVYDRWVAKLSELGGARHLPNVAHGVDVQPCGRDGKALGKYVSKLTDVAAEVSRADTKSGRAGHLSAFQLLDVDEPWAAAAWYEYVSATKCKRSVFFSRGLRELLGLEEDKDDAEVLEDELQGEHDVIALLDAPLYEDVRHDGRWVGLDAALRAMARGQWDAAAAALGASLTEGVSESTGEVVPMLTRRE